MRCIKLLVLALFLGFQTAQSLHTHTAATPDHCSICQAVQQSVSTGPVHAAQIVTALMFERLIVSRQHSFARIDLVSFVSTRAPPAV